MMMKVRRSVVPVALIALASALVVGCEDKPSASLAPTASALASAQPTSVKALKFAVDAPESKVGFLMEAPVEKIHGKAPGSMAGEVFVDLLDVTKSTGLVKVDLFKLELFQQKRAKEGEEFGEEVKDATQNEHARAWLEISDDAPEKEREANRYIEFSIKKVETSGAKNVLEMTGDERTVQLTVSGDFRLHGRQTTKTAELELVFRFDGDKPVSAHVKTVKPFDVGLEEHEVRPRKGFGVIAKATLETLAPKVASRAAVSLDFVMKL